MSPAESRFIRIAQRRIADLQPEVAAALLRALRVIRDSLNDAELARLIESGAIDRLIDDVFADQTLDRALIPFRQRLRQTTERGFRFATADLPRRGKIDGVLSVAFDHLSPNVITAIRTMESRALDTLKADIRQVVRDTAEAGLRAGQAPVVVARGLRDVIGMAPNQAQYVRNLRAELEAGRYADAQGRALLDRRFNLSKLDALSGAERAKRIDTIVGAYERSMIAHNTAVNTQLTTIDAYRVGQRLAWEDAVAKGVIPSGFAVTKTWVHLDPQPNPRPEHQALDGETVPIDRPYSTGQMSAGLGDWGCHCLDRFGIVKI